MQLKKLLTYKNTNQKCQRAITPIHETKNVIDYLKACHKLRSKTQKIQMLAKTMAATFKKKNESYFVCRDKSHLKMIAQLLILPYISINSSNDIKTGGFGNTDQKQSLWASIISKYT